jgi:hypothetical protein
MSLSGTLANRFVTLGLSVYRWVRSQAIGRLPWGASYFAYRLIRRAPKLYFLLRAVLMGEMSGPSK